MGAVNDAIHERGGHAIGVIHEIWTGDELHPAIKELYVAKGNDLGERKHLLKKHSDAFLVLPGGVGTFEELFEIASERQIGFHRRPLVIFNVENYFDGLLTQMRVARSTDILYKNVDDILTVVDNAVDAINACEIAETDWVSRRDLGKTTDEGRRSRL